MSINAGRLEHWLRTDFIAMNTELEQRYFQQDNRENVDGIGDDIKAQIEREGHTLIVPLKEEGNTDEGFDHAFNVLGNVGIYLAALRRHELTNPERESTSPFKEASALAMHIGTSLGIAPRFATSHLTTHNRAVDGVYKTFTSLPAEFLFIDYNAYGILSYKRAADNLKRILPMGISHPMAPMLLAEAERALHDVARYNAKLFDELDRDAFFYSVRPYYKPYRVGRQEYRGANAGDFSEINEIDLLLGACQANDPYYGQLLIDKMLFMMPADQASLRDTMRRQSLLSQLVEAAETSAHKAWFKSATEAFLRVFEAHGHAATQHHNQLVHKYIVGPSEDLPEHKKSGLTASGPPLQVLINALEKLRDMRTAAPRTDIRTAHDQIALLKHKIDYESAAV